MKITAVKEQEKNKKKLSVFVDNDYFDSVLKEVFIKSGLKKGDEITKERWTEIKAEHEARYAFDRGLFYLQRRDRSEKEMRDYLVKKGICEETVAATTAKLEEYGYLDDVRFAKAVVSDHINIKKRGRKAIVFALKRFGVAPHIIEEALASYDDELEQDNALSCAQSLLKKYGRIEDQYKRRQKLLAALARRGYGWEAINQAVRAVLEDVEDS